MQKIETDKAPSPGGHYSQGVVHQGVLYVSGQLAIDPHSGEKKLGSMEEQTRQVLENVAAVVRAAGSDLDRILKVTVYISDIEEWGTVNRIYAEFFGEHRPARAVVPCGELHYGFKIEMEAVAAV